MVMRPIGVIRTPFTSSEGCPIQSRFSRACGTVRVFARYGAGLKGITRFSHIILIYYFDRSDKESLLARPYLEKRKRGIFHNPLAGATQSHRHLGCPVAVAARFNSESYWCGYAG